MNIKMRNYLILFAVVMVLFIVFVMSLFLQQNSGQQQSVSSPSSSQNQNTASVNNINRNNKAPIPTISLPPLGSTAQNAARQFYMYYFSSIGNPFANGAYKNSPYLSQDFKDVISNFYRNGNEPVFCAQNRRANITVGNEQTVYYNNSYLTQEVISDAGAGNKQLYSVLLENENGNWLIFDVNCL